MIRLEITEAQFEAQSKKKLADVVALYDAVNRLKAEYPDKTSFLDKFLSNEPVEMIYHGGSTPGKSRQIKPQKINADGSFSAYCTQSNASKSFKLEKVEIV